MTNSRIQLNQVPVIQHAFHHHHRYGPAQGSTPVPGAVEEIDTTELATTVAEIDRSYQPSFDESFASDMEPTALPKDERKFLVFQSSLQQLLSHCRLCHSPCVNRYSVLGTMVTVESRCQQKHIKCWQSQPTVGAKPAGNVLLAGAILFSGCSIAPVLRCLKLINMAAITERCFYTYQKCCLRSMRFQGAADLLDKQNGRHRGRLGWLWLLRFTRAQRQVLHIQVYFAHRLTKSCTVSKYK